VTAVLEAKRVVSGYGEVEILHGVSLTLNENEIVAVIGPNGAGKSTLLKAVFGLVSVRGGSIHLMGRDITNLSPDRIVQSGMSYVPQTENVFPSLTINENLEMGGFVRRDGLSPKMVDSIFEKIAEINRGGAAILLVEQNAREALSFSNRAYVLAMGENRFEGEAKGMLDNEEVGRLYLGA